MNCARAQTERGNTRGGAIKKREISHNLLSINLNFSVRTGLSKTYTEMGERVDPRLRELASRGRRKPGGGIHAT